MAACVTPNILFEHTASSGGVSSALWSVIRHNCMPYMYAWHLSQAQTNPNASFSFCEYRSAFTASQTTTSVAHRYLLAMLLLYQHCPKFSGVGILTIASTRSSTRFRPSAEITCPRYVICCRKNSHLSRRSFTPYSFSAERTCLRCCRCSYFVRPVRITSSRYAATYGMPETRLSTNFWNIPVLVPVQMTIDCTETVLYACLRRTISLWHHQALLVNMHRTYQVLRSDVLLAAWRTSCSSILGMGSWSTCSLGFTVIL